MEQRQGQPTAEAALDHAIRTIRAQSQDYRNPHGRAADRMSKQVRQSLAATLADYARILEQMKARLPVNESGTNDRDSTVPKDNTENRGAENAAK